MASYMADYSLNLGSDQLANRTIQIRVHFGAPGNAGTNNRIGTASVDVSAAGWTAASGGVVQTTSDAEFGVLDASNAHTVTAYSLWDGTNFMGWADMSANVAVGAGESFTLNSGTVSMTLARP